MCACCTACDTPHTNVVLHNEYPRLERDALVVYRAFWQAVSFAEPIAPGRDSGPRESVPASSNTAYVLLSRGFEPNRDAAALPVSFVVLESRHGFDLHVGETLHIHVDDANFDGNCAAGKALTQKQADFITQRVFAEDFVGQPRARAGS